MTVQQWLGVWLLVAVVTALLDYQKGRSGWWGLILGLICGPVGLYIVLLSHENGPELELRAIRRGRLKKCPQCIKANYAKARTCQFCGYVFEDQ